MILTLGYCCWCRGRLKPSDKQGYHFCERCDTP